VSVLYYERVRGLLTGVQRPRNAAGLTVRELDCLGYVAGGLNDSEIGEKLGISQNTVHEHVERAKRRLAMRSRAEAVAIAVSLGLVAP
jgi:DNA-binding CsgD family transcriptional regulator